MDTWTNGHNPLLPPEHHIPDGEAHVMPDGRLYVYGSYDNQQDFYCSDQYRAASTGDMKTWTVHDIALKAQDIPWFGNPAYPHYPGLDWSRPTPFMRRMRPEMYEKPEAEWERAWTVPAVPPLLYAPDCIHKDGKYWLYFCMSDESEGVAVSDSPAGPFRDPVQLPCGQIDPAIFVDDDGSAYLYWGQFRSMGVRLNPDMVSFDPNQVVHDLVTEEEHFFHEGSSMRKIGNTYYYVFADVERGRPTALGYATGKSPLGPFTYRGIIIDNTGCDRESWNNHGSIECFGGQWYVFYHRSSRGTQLNRRLCAEPIQILPDGTIPEVKMTSQGPGEPFGSGETIYGFQACGLTGHLAVGPDAAREEVLGDIRDGDRAVFRYVRAKDAFRSAVIESRGRGRVTLLLDGERAGEADLTEGGRRPIPLAAPAAPGREQELTLAFSDPSDLAVKSLALYE